MPVSIKIPLHKYCTYTCIWGKICITECDYFPITFICGRRKTKEMKDILRNYMYMYWYVLSRPKFPSHYSEKKKSHTPTLSLFPHCCRTLFLIYHMYMYVQQHISIIQITYVLLISSKIGIINIGYLIHLLCHIYIYPLNTTLYMYFDLESRQSVTIIKLWLLFWI